MENVKEPNKKYLITKILISTKLPNPIRDIRVSKLVFIMIHCLKFWAQCKSTIFSTRIQYMLHISILKLLKTGRFEFFILIIEFSETNIFSHTGLTKKDENFITTRNLSIKPLKFD